MKLPKLPETDADPKKPKTLWDTIITSTPVVMTVIATLLAGLSNSELTQSLVYRSQAAQHQSKAGDQWGYFQAKKLRAAQASTTVEQMQVASDISALTPEGYAGAVDRLVAKIDAISTSKLAPEQAGNLKAEIAATAAGVKDALATLSSPLPPVAEMPISDDHLRKVYDDVKKDPMEEDSSGIYGTFTDEALRDALRAAGRNTRTADEALRPMADAIKRIQNSLDALSACASEVRRATTQSSQPSLSLGASDRQSPVELRQLAGDLSAAKLRFDAARYDQEAKLNQQIAYLYEIAVRKATWQSDRHRMRSKYFFYGMLGAQAAVLIATFSLAVRERSWMWSVAASLGVMAVSYAGYVYLFT